MSCLINRVLIKIVKNKMKRQKETTFITKQKQTSVVLCYVLTSMKYWFFFIIYHEILYLKEGERYIMENGRQHCVSFDTGITKKKKMNTKTFFRGCSKYIFLIIIKIVKKVVKIMVIIIKVVISNPSCLRTAIVRMTWHLTWRCMKQTNFI